MDTTTACNRILATEIQDLIRGVDLTTALRRQSVAIDRIYPAVRSDTPIATYPFSGTLHNAVMGLEAAVTKKPGKLNNSRKLSLAGPMRVFFAARKNVVGLRYRLLRSC